MQPAVFAGVTKRVDKNGGAYPNMYRFTKRSTKMLHNFVSYITAQGCEPDSRCKVYGRVAGHQKQRWRDNNACACP